MSIDVETRTLECLAVNSIPCPRYAENAESHATIREINSLFIQKLVPSAGCGSFLFAGAAMYRLISMRIVSMVKSRFHTLILGSFERSTYHVH